MKKLFSIFLFSLALSAFAQQPVGIFQYNEDIGAVKHPGSASYDEETQVYSIFGSGANVWNNKDECHYLYNKISGDFILTADFEFIGDNSNAVGHRKIGWMVRNLSEEGSASVNAAKHYDEHCLLQWRPYRGMYMRDPQEERFFPKRGNLQTVQLKRIGNVFTMKLAHQGEPLQLVASETIELKNEVLAGIFICSHDADAIAHAKVWNVRIDKPIPNIIDANPKVKNIPVRDILGCRLEILDITNGNRKVIYESKDRMQSPNWMPDAKKLLFNTGGSLFTIPVTGGTPEKLNTGNIGGMNNNHVISFDGKMVGFTSHQKEGNGDGSTIFKVPITGGEPQMITKNTPTYLHGWSPNGKDLVITGRRDNKETINLYRLSLKDGKETTLTSYTSGMVEGPEYSPDGKYIYYNDNVTGTMQIWRMKPDGSGKEQLTFDEYHNWYPHVSPDGNSLVFVTFPENIDPNEHPYNTEVMLRVLKLNSPGGVRVVAHLYGGQGTMNVNSWSPDSNHIAFISNSEKQ